MKTRWIVGTVLVLGFAGFVVFYELPVLLHPILPFTGFFRRSLYILLLSAALCLARVIKGPTAPDRAVAIDTLGILVVGICSLLGIPTGSSWYIDIGIAWALQSFIGTLALAKYLEGKRLDE